MGHRRRRHRDLDTVNSQISIHDLKVTPSQTVNNNTIDRNKRLATMLDTANCTALLLRKPNSGLPFLPRSHLRNINSEQSTRFLIKRILSNRRAHSRNAQLLL
jgi:hypothetical protein